MVHMEKMIRNTPSPEDRAAIAKLIGNQEGLDKPLDPQFEEDVRNLLEMKDLGVKEIKNKIAELTNLQKKYPDLDTEDMGNALTLLEDKLPTLRQ